MEEGLITERFVSQLAAEHRVLVLGGMAMIAQGLSRPTKDTDIWLDPKPSADLWLDALIVVMHGFSESSFWSLRDKTPASAKRAVEDARDVGVIRVIGLDMPLDVFRRPNECLESDFDGFWQNSTPLTDGTHLPDPIDLYLTKADTGREQDLQDQLYLEGKVRALFRERLPVCHLAEAQQLLDRFLDPQVLECALENPNPSIQKLALNYLGEFEAEGDPYSADLLAAWKERKRQIDEKQ